MNAKRSIAALIALLLLPVGLAWLQSEPEAATDARLLGLWAQFEPTKEGDPVRFYYFHDGGIGLYRYGRMGLNNTHSYKWSVDDDRLTLTFNKSGKRAETALRLEQDPDGTEVLVLVNDPYEPRPVRYRKQRPPVQAEASGEHPFARMWVNQTQYQTGGMGFSIYQLKPPALDGRGVGWFHQGDFDNWSTETLYYRRTGDQLELFFPLRGERQVTPLHVGQAEGRRVLGLAVDPRNFWQRQIYVDGGASFGLELVGAPPPLDALARATVASTDD